MIEARGLTVARGSRDVCRDVSVSVAEGECLGIVGPNGSGKSSLLLGLRGLLPTRGELRLDGRDPRAVRRRDMAHLVAVVPQRMEFAFPYHVEEMVLLGRSPHRRPWEGFGAADRELVRALLARLGLAALAGERVNAISGGERRKVFLARALAQEAPILFLDEPTAGLDPAAQEDLAALITDLNVEGRTVVIVLHDLRLATASCDRIIGLRDGAQFFDGAPGDVLVEPQLTELYGIPWQRFESGGQSVLLPNRGKGSG